MKVILQKDVENVGKAGEVKEVADGFAQNFLLPNGLAEPANDANVARAEELQAKQRQIDEQELANNQKLAEKLSQKEITLKVKSKEGKLFGSVNKKQIADELSTEELEVKESMISLDEPIKETGEFKVKVNLAHGIESEVRLIVEAE